MTTKQKVLLVVRFWLFFVLWYVVAQIALGLLSGFMFLGSHDYQMVSQEELMIHFLEDFFNSSAPVIIGILSLVFAIGVSTLQTLSKSKSTNKQTIQRNNHLKASDAAGMPYSVKQESRCLLPCNLPRVARQQSSNVCTR
ncbi:MAG: hypothetical protein OXG88_00575 [Gammaproteobacteria bacterium]|nr:hypothetical protein [Gammaproteobacteria bacterium]